MACPIVRDSVFLFSCSGLPAFILQLQLYGPAVPFACGPWEYSIWQVARRYIQSWTTLRVFSQPITRPQNFSLPSSNSKMFKSRHVHIPLPYYSCLTFMSGINMWYWDQKHTLRCTQTKILLFRFSLFLFFLQKCKQCQIRIIKLWPESLLSCILSWLLTC